MKIEAESLAVFAVVAAAAAAALYVWRKGGIAPAAEAIGAGAVNAVAGAAQGAASATAQVASNGIGAIGATVGLPTPSDTLTDPAQVRWIIDNHGYFRASIWASAGALWSAMSMPEGSGTPPPASSPAAQALGVPAAASASSNFAPVPAYGGTFEDLSSSSWDPASVFGLRW